MGIPFVIQSDAKVALICPVCESPKPSWEWQDAHGVATCRHCATDSSLLHSAAGVNNDEPLPQSCLKKIWFPRYKRWWKETSGKKAFVPWWRRVGGGKDLPKREAPPLPGLLHLNTKDKRAKVPLVRGGMFWGTSVGSWQCGTCHKPSIYLTVAKTTGPGSWIEVPISHYYLEKEAVEKVLEWKHAPNCHIKIRLRKDRLYYVGTPC